jgi:hypothetical protein
MFSHTIIRTVLGTAVAAMLLSPAASAGDSNRDRQVGLDPAIVTALHNRAEMTVAAPLPLDPAIAAAMRNRSDATSAPLPLDPAIRAAIRNHETSSARPDDRAGARGVGSLRQPARVVPSSGFDWSSFGVGVGAALAGLLLALGSALRWRQARTRVVNA